MFVARLRQNIGGSAIQLPASPKKRSAIYLREAPRSGITKCVAYSPLRIAVLKCQWVG
jgi:hypothetical protein